MGRWSRLWVPALLAGAGVAPGRRVLDVACGTGQVALAAAAAVGPAGRVAGADLSAPMLAAARARSAGARVHLAVMDGQRLACRDGGFDAVICALGLMFFPDPLAGLREFHRVLAPGGRMAATVWTDADRAPFPGLLLRTLGRHLPQEQTALNLAFALGDGDRLAALIAGAGFAEVRVAGEVRRLEFEGFDDFWGPVEAGGSRASQAYLALPDDARRRLRDDLRAALAPFQRDGRLVMDCEALVATGRR